MQNLPSFRCALSAGFLCNLALVSLPVESAKSQVISDQTLGEASTIVTGAVSNDRLVVTGGAQRNTNLFHSFDIFSIADGTSVFFEQSNTIETVFARVTGGDVSSINGLIGVSGGADLFLINPAGISFGNNAEIQSSGSFIATSADRVIFSDELEFAGRPSEESLLSIEVPIGLGFSGNSSISVEDVGHTLLGGSLLFPYVEAIPDTGLSVLPNRTIALLGNNVSLRGGVVRAPDGSVVLGSVQNGVVSIFPENEGWRFAYDNVDSFGGITLDEFSFIDASGFSGGEINMFGGDIQLLDSSVAITTSVSQNTSDSQIGIFGDNILLDGNISRIDPSVDLFDNRPTSPIPLAPSSLIVDNFGSQAGGDIEIESQTLSIVDGSFIYVRSFGEGVPGNVDISTSQLSVRDSIANENGSSIAVANVGPSNLEGVRGGFVEINAELVDVLNGGSITTSTFNQGDAGRLEINAEDVRVTATSERGRLPSQISSLSLQAGLSPLSGNSGELVINTGSLAVSQGGAIGTSTDNSGDAGNLIISARDFVEIDSSTFSSLGPSQIGSNAIRVSPEIRDAFGLSGIPTGEGGSLFIETPNLVVQDNGLIAVRNEGTGSAGDLTLRVENLTLQDGGQVSAATLQGDGGNIGIQVDTLLLSRGFIDATSAQTGTGGNVLIDGSLVALLDGSFISANADQGSGGRVFIDTPNLVQSLDSEITATSSAGPELDGVVDIQGQEGTPSVDLEVNVDFESAPLILSCINRTEGGFVITGQGGIPFSQSSTPRSWNGWGEREGAPEIIEPNETSQIIEAQGWTYDKDGNVRLVSTILSENLSTQNRNTGCVSTFS